MIPVITIRPALRSARTVKEGAAAGLAIQVFPLSEAHPVDWSGPDPRGIDGLLVGSANAFRHGGKELARYAGKPVFAVGPATARAAQRAGFLVRLAGDGGLQAVLGLIRERPARLLRLAGARHVPIDPPHDIVVTTCEVYAVETLPMPDSMAAVLRDGAVILLHSAGSAEHLRAECERLGLDLSRLRLAALGPRIAAAAGPGWGVVRWAEQPADGALLALAADMCH